MMMIIIFYYYYNTYYCYITTIIIVVMMRMVLKGMARGDTGHDEGYSNKEGNGIRLRDEGFSTWDTNLAARPSHTRLDT